MQSLLGGRVAVTVRKLLDKDCPGPLSCLTGYVVMGFGCIVVMLVGLLRCTVRMAVQIQSSSVFRSALNPLVAIGVVTLDRMYPLIIGGNIGTTFTGILAALSADSRKLQV
uniref:Inner membrane protein YqgA n=1 Tax=Steinernema glaseri TaxID=37863 RepID=A0A1I7ZPI0_9BILA